MEKDVIISILGKQSYEGSEQDSMELVTEGKLVQGDDYLRLSYEESELTGMTGTTTLFQVEPQRITLLRIGSVRSEMVFEQGRRHTSLYNTPYGSMEVGIKARRLNSSLTMQGGKLEIDYEIEIDHRLAGQNLFRIDVREAAAAPNG